MAGSPDYKNPFIRLDIHRVIDLNGDGAIERVDQPDGGRRVLHGLRRPQGGRGRPRDGAR